jgi:DNA invertase Pin-like site-specific DNA recombinase
MTIIGYARVSTALQSVDAQRESLAAAGCDLIFSESESGARSDRPELARAIAALQSSDTLLVTRLDRLARSTHDLLATLASVSERGATFRSIADPWADTTTPHGRLLLTVLGGLAEFERSLILARTAEGRARAVAAGRRMGRKPSLSAWQIAEVRERLHAGESHRALARSYGVSHTSIQRIAKNQ